MKFLKRKKYNRYILSGTSDYIALEGLLSGKADALVKLSSTLALASSFRVLAYNHSAWEVSRNKDIFKAPALSVRNHNFQASFEIPAATGVDWDSIEFLDADFQIPSRKLSRTNPSIFLRYFYGKNEVNLFHVAFRDDLPAEQVRLLDDTIKGLICQLDIKEVFFSNTPWKPRGIDENDIEVFGPRCLGMEIDDKALSKYWDRLSPSSLKLFGS